jgi:hypothetical protein
MPAPKSPSQIVHHKKQLVENLMFDSNLLNKEMIEKSGLPERTFYWYKRKIIEEQAQIWNTIAIDNPKYRAIKLIEALEKSVVLNKEIRDNPKYSIKDRTEASKNVIQVETYLYRLAELEVD